MVSQLSRGIVVGIAVGVFSIATASYADGKGSKKLVEFSELDTNSDGQLTEEEFNATIQVFFDSADANGDGMLTGEELEAAIAERMSKFISGRTSKALERLDGDGDGMISLEEYENRGRKGEAFNRLDQDNDGVISESEYDRARSKSRRHRDK